jgi:hypothetical protein
MVESVMFNISHSSGKKKTLPKNGPKQGLQNRGDEQATYN